MSEHTTETDTDRYWTSWAARITAHAIGVAVTAAIVALPFLDTVTLEAMWLSAHQGQYLESTWWEFALHLAASGCLWTLAVLIFEVVTGRREPVRKLVGAKTGSVMTETLIVLPIFLLLTFGIAQLAVNNIAAIVCDTAAFQAGRTAWLWHSEAATSRMGVTDEDVEEMTRIQAAAVLTPVAPGDFIVDVTGQTEKMEQMRGSYIGGQLPLFASDQGEIGENTAQALILAGSGPGIMDTRFSKALDESSFRERTARKFTTAYVNTEVQLEDNGQEFGATVTYQHHQAFPMVGGIFGSFQTVGGRPGYYWTLERTYVLPKQILPNPELPE